MIKNSLKIYKRDLKSIFTNYAVLIVILALAILPSLYAWINIKASWDPYGEESTSRIKVDIVNKDKGTLLKEKEINVGNEVVESLKKNKLLGWQFVSAKEADRDLERGKVYASIIIPEDFSEDITSLVTSDIREAQIIYRKNEKLNAIAPKIISKGATGIQDTINEQVTSTVSGVVLNMAKDLGIQLEAEVLPNLVKAADILHNIEDKFPDLNNTMKDATVKVNNVENFLSTVKDYLPKVNELLQNSQDLTNSIDDFITMAKAGFNTLAPTLKSDLQLANDIASELNTYVNSLEEALNSGYSKAPEIINNMLAKIKILSNITNSIVKILDGLNNINSNAAITAALEKFQNLNNKITAAEETLNKINSDIAAGKKPDLTLINNLKAFLNDINAITSDLYNNFDTQIAGNINGILNKGNEAAEEVRTVLKDAESKIPDINNTIASAEDVLGKADSGIASLKEILPTVEMKLTSLSDKLDEINSSGELIDLIDLVKDNVSERIDFLKDPVKIKEETIFPMGNYGSQMAPFYSVLAAWVGLTLLVSILALDTHGEYSANEVYLGKLLTFLTVSLLQGIIIALGDLYLLKIYCSNPFIFIIGMLYTSITFTFIVYSLVSVFGNAGKVIAIIIMVLQVAGSGGTFPIQLTSPFFITLNPFLPFTYAISFLREAIGGIVRQVLINDITILFIYIAISFLISLFLKKSLNKLSSKFEEKFKQSGIGE